MPWAEKNIDSLFPRCKLALAHVVLYEAAGSAQGVKCKTCGSEHRCYEPGPRNQQRIPTERRPRVGREAAPPTPVGPADARLWELWVAATASALAFIFSRRQAVACLRGEKSEGKR